MGANESTKIEVNFGRPSLFYFAGEEVAGHISYQNQHERLIIDEIFLEFIGECGYAAKETRHYYDNAETAQPEPYEEYQRIPFINIRFSVVRPPNGQHETIPILDQYSWPFTFTLPNHLPPSLIPSATSHPYVKYYVRVVFDKPWYKANSVQVHPLTIFPRVNLLDISGAQESVPFSYTNRKKVRVSGHLLQRGIVPSQKVIIQLNLQNPKRCIIKRIEAVLTRHHQVAQDRHEEVVLRTDLPNLRNFVGTELQRTFILLVPSIQVVPSHKFKAEFNRKRHFIITNYELGLKIKSHGMLTDFKIKLPVIIGTEPTLDQQRQNNDYISAFIGSASIMNYDEPPPSYESVVSNETM